MLTQEIQKGHFMLISMSRFYVLKALSQCLNTKLHLPLDPPKELNRGQGISTAGFVPKSSGVHTHHFLYSAGFF